MKEKAMRLHQQGGCRVFIPDIFKGKTTLEVAEAKHVRPQPESAEVLPLPACCCLAVSACCLNPPARFLLAVVTSTLQSNALMCCCIGAQATS